MLGPGDRVGSWVVEALVGVGGAGAVYRARHMRLGHLAALKVMAVARADARDRLLREGRAQATLAHPNVVGVHDVLELGEGAALVLEWVDGPSLERWLERFRPTRDEALALFWEIAGALAHAHAAGVVHLDLKPANVLLQRTGGGFVPKVADFGLARVSADARSPVAGTAGWAAPEQLGDPLSIDARADVFSLGALLYTLLSGAPPFPGDDLVAVLNAAARGAWAPLDDPLADLVHACLAPAPGGRPANAGALLPTSGLNSGARVRRGLELPAEAWMTEAAREAAARWAEAPRPIARPLSVGWSTTPDTAPPRVLTSMPELIARPSAPIDPHARTVKGAGARRAAPGRPVRFSPVAVWAVVGAALVVVVAVLAALLSEG